MLSRRTPRRQAVQPARRGIVLERDHARQLVAEPGVDRGLAAERLGILAGADAAEQRVEPVPGGAGRRRRAARVASELARAHRLAVGLAEGAADAHRLADALHLRGQRLVGAGELLEGEARHLDHHVVQGRLERGRRGAGDVVRDLVERVAHGELGGDLGDRVAGGLRGQRRGARHARVHLDDHELAGLAVERELDVRAAGLDAHRADHGGRRVAQRLELAVRQRHRRRHADRVAGVHAHRVEVLDRADDHHVVGLSRITSSSNSPQPATDSSTSTWPIGLSARPRATTSSKLARRGRTPPPCRRA